MAKNYFITGIGMWAKVQKPDEKYGHYCIDVYPDAGGMKVMDESGLSKSLQERVGKDGTPMAGKKYWRFRRDPESVLEDMEPAPRVLLYDAETKEYKPFTGAIGNGSFVNCRVEVYKSKKNNRLGHRLVAVAVENLVEYDGDNEDDLPF